MEARCKTIASQPSWVVRSSDVELAVTKLGAHMAPVTFYRKSGSPIQPYYISPWQGQGLKIDDPVLAPLRGDFFCMPFGANADAWRGEKHDLHGDPPGKPWKLVDVAGGCVTRLTLSLRARTRPGKITKTLQLVRGQNVVYSRHVLEGFSGRMPLGHHATLAMERPEGCVRIATSPTRFGGTNPVAPGNPAEGEYSCALPNQKFKSLARVPLIWQKPKMADFSALPARRGFTDLVGVFNKPGARAWTTATFSDENFIWFSIKDPAMLPSTLLWISNHGRHDAPWNSQNSCLGLEDICGYYADGLAASLKPNALSKAGVATSVALSPKKPTAIHYIQGVVKAPRGFRKVRSAKFAPGQVTFTSTTGKQVTAEVNHDFIRTGCVESC